MKKYDAIVAGMDIRLNELKKIYENTAEVILFRMFARKF